MQHAHDLVRLRSRQVARAEVQLTADTVHTDRRGSISEWIPTMTTMDAQFIVLITPTLALLVYAAISEIRRMRDGNNRKDD